MKFPKSLILPLARYYCNRAAANIKTGPYHRDWNKEEDLKYIEGKAEALGFAFAASCGTFWFVKNGYSFELSESDYVFGGVRTKNKKEGK